MSLVDMQNTVDQSHSEIEERKVRKKLQNRLNQRVRRNRLQEENDQPEFLGKNAYQIRRWRIDSDEPYQTHTRGKVTDETHRHHLISSTEKKSTKFTSYSALEFGPDSPSASVSDPIILPAASVQFYDPKIVPAADQLLHLIHYNAFRGLYKNKILLGRTAISLSPGRKPERFDEAFPSFSVVVPRSSEVVAPGNLMPTQSQMSLIHSTWINTLPFPAMRDNLIKWEGSFNHAEFAVDVLGYIMDSILFPQPEGSSVTSLTVGNQGVVEELEDEDEVTANRNGLIVWGEPDRMENWEAMPGFLRKYAWAMPGCDGLIESSNRWRRIRGVDPLRFSVPQEL
ncbi:hypothetical protein N7486_006626 [Penicillium sp. IBT 16267x]|nr:hypothetical protein N7486_006626 [Penicillium sp. IBT 16267x]